MKETSSSDATSATHKPAPSLNQIIELKNELFKEKEIFNAQKRAAAQKPNNKRLKFGLENNSLAAAPKENSIYAKEATVESLWQKSFESLQQKQQIYESLSRDPSHSQVANDSDLEDSCLVDFAQKPLEKVESNELVEVTDEFGRTRVLRSSELESFYASQHEDASKHLQPQHFDSKAEPRKKGVGFFVFSSEEEQRQKQLNEIKALSSETLQSKREFADVLSEKERLRKLRLEKIEKARKSRQGAA